MVSPWHDINWNRYLDRADLPTLDHVQYTLLQVDVNRPLPTEARKFITVDMPNYLITATHQSVIPNQIAA
jgi:hypothetical protein